MSKKKVEKKSNVPAKVPKKPRAGTKVAAAKKAEPLKAKKALPLSSDLLKINSLKKEEENHDDGRIVLSDTWYEFRVFMKKFNVSRNTVKRWISEEWLAYHKIGKIIFFNQADINDMMRRFRSPGE